MKFNKISQTQYLLDEVNKYCSYEDIKLPQRATKGSAGYDIYALSDFTLQPKESIKFPTGINVHLDDDKFLLIVPRSGLGCKYQVMLANTCGVIDCDYCASDNEGHIWVKLVNMGEKVISVKKGEAVCQGIILQYFKTENDNADTIRNGGFGSTTK